MDAFWKCLLACILSLVPFGGDNVRTVIGSTATDEQAVRNLVSEHEIEITDIMLDWVVEDQLPKELTDNISDPKILALPEYQRVRKIMRKFGIKSVAHAGTTTEQYVVFCFGEHDKGPCTNLVLRHLGFTKLFAIPDNVHRVSDDWAVVQANDHASLLKALMEVKPIKPYPVHKGPVDFEKLGNSSN